MDDENEVESLADLFPSLELFAPAADRFLRESRPDNIQLQLLSRRVRRVIINPLLSLLPSKSALEVDHDDNFRISILTKSLATPFENAFRLGHELARTFYHNLTMTPPESYLPEELRGVAEGFCNVFAERWIDKVTIEALVAHFEIVLDPHRTNRRKMFLRISY